MMPPDPPVCSVVVCSRNRAGTSLPSALQSLFEQSLPPGDFEILLIDNASTDHTRELVLELGRKHTNLRYIHEPRIGVAAARNRGWREAVGRWVAYLDDDCVAEPEWLEQIRKAFEEVKPAPGCVGGKISLLWDGPRPGWMDDAILPGLGLMDWSEEPILLDERHFFGEGNSAYPRHLLEEIGGFEEALGRIGDRLLSNEGVWVRQRIEEMGYRFYYSPHIAIHHRVATHKLSRRWCLDMFFWQGASDVLVPMLKQPPTLLQRLRALAHVSARMLWTLRRVPWMVCKHRDPRWFYQWCRLSSQAGEFRAWLGAA
jgi:glycosyltransferase involved in cell wall biosynthesis